MILRKQSWMIYSGDIPFVNRLFLDNDIGMHLAVEGHIVDSREWDDDDEANDKKENATRMAIDFIFHHIKLVLKKQFRTMMMITTMTTMPK